MIDTNKQKTYLDIVTKVITEHKYEIVTLANKSLHSGDIKDTFKYITNVFKDEALKTTLTQKDMEEFMLDKDTQRKVFKIVLGTVKEIIHD